MSRQEAAAALSAFVDFQERCATHTRRREANLADLLGRTNDGMNVLFEHRRALANLDLLESLTSIFRDQARMVQSLVEVNADEAGSKSQFFDDLRKAFKEAEHA